MRGEHVGQGASAGTGAGSAPRARGTRPAHVQQLVHQRISPACAGNTGSGATLAGVPADQPACAGNTGYCSTSSYSSSDQPRVRGEHLIVISHRQRPSGSAPRARGTRRRQRLPDRVERISPACAGNTACRCATSTQTADQPRVRGEHWPGLAFTGALFGSAPRARGTPLVSGDVYVSCRISPACAGNTGGLGASSSCGSDQPRVRGEHGLQFGELRLIHGSAPRARGTRLLGPTGDLQVRISPACAGNTPYRCTRHAGLADQPRVRGEHLASPTIARLQDGSAPRARGTRLPLDVGDVLQRISPACAGNTRCPPLRQRNRADQPRVRGEHPPRPAEPESRTGSAPRARGTQDDKHPAYRLPRISPACAGNTSTWRASRSPRPDQPRVRGEHAGGLGHGEVDGGSAPRARGTLSAGGAIAPDDRISPACAGNTPPPTRRASSSTDQPRVRGEHARNIDHRGHLHGSRVRGEHAERTAKLRSLGGSAPRARGTPSSGPPAQHPNRISPACAGNTDTLGLT